MRWLVKPPHRSTNLLPDGRRRCGWCGGPVDPPRRNWCSRKCVDEYKLRRGSAEVRRQVFKRDRGICAKCGLDCRALKLELRRLRWGTRKTPGSYTKWRERRDQLIADGFDVHRKTYYDVDHIIPVERGGGACGLENYQTLCQVCHRKKTAEQAAFKAIERRFWLKVEPGKSDECWMWKGSLDSYGYGQLYYKKLRLVHRVSYQIHKGPIPDGLHVLHSCDNPGCVNPDHLHLGTHPDNMMEKKERGREADTSGVKNGRAKLTEAEVLEIRAK